MYTVVAHIPISLLNFGGVACRIFFTSSSANSPKSGWEGTLVFYAEGKYIFKNVLSHSIKTWKKYFHSWRFATFLWINIILSVVLTADVYHRNCCSHSWRFSTSKIYIFWGSWKTSAVSTTCLNGWNSTLQDAWYIRYVRIIRFLWTQPTIWLLILRSTQFYTKYRPRV